MSDFVYTREKQPQGVLSAKIMDIYNEIPPDIFEFHGNWGSLAVSQNLYMGFDPYENEIHILVVIGGPVLTFQDNSFLVGTDQTYGSRAIYKRWISNDHMQWDSDLSGPFAILLIDKVKNNLSVITDMLSWIPVYVSSGIETLVVGTHIDVAARASGKEKDLDPVSIADFILHGIVTYPYTIYSKFKQIKPGTSHKWALVGKREKQSTTYWMPVEDYSFLNIKEASKSVRSALINFIQAVTKDMDKVGLFITGGEDSRAVLAALPKHLEKDAFIFLDGMNREGRIAKKAASIYGAQFKLFLRSFSHYIDVLPQCSDLVGSGSQYGGVHTYKFHLDCGLDQYPAIFGGYDSDTLLKGYFIKKYPGHWRYPFLPEFKYGRDIPCKQILKKTFKSDILNEVLKRRCEHYHYVQQFRPDSSDEWFSMWPMSMDVDITNIHGNRRLFRSYEPFISGDIVKIGASVPQSWKLNRRLFRLAVKPLLKTSKWLSHTDGRLPYFPWYCNVPLGASAKFYQKIRDKLGLNQVPQGAWADFNKLFNSGTAEMFLVNYQNEIKCLHELLIGKDKCLRGKDFYSNVDQKANFFQLLYFLKSNNG